METKKEIVNAFRKSGIAFDDEIPRDGPELFVLRMKGNLVYHFIIWGCKIRGIWYHWRLNHSEPHFQDDENCPGCKARQPKKWKGFVHCYCVELKQEVFLELTPASSASLVAQFAPGASLRGCRIQVKRTGANNGRLYTSVLTPITETSSLPAEKDPRPSILKLWGLDPDDIQRWLGPPDVENTGKADFS